MKRSDLHRVQNVKKSPKHVIEAQQCCSVKGGNVLSINSCIVTDFLNQVFNLL